MPMYPDGKEDTVNYEKKDIQSNGDISLLMLNGSILRIDGQLWVNGVLYNPVTAGTISDGDKGDISVTAGAWAVDNNTITNAKLADMAQNRITGRVTTGTGDPEDLTPVQARTVICSDSGGGTTNYLRADGNFGTPGAVSTEDVIDAVAGSLVAGANINIAYNDPANTITITGTGGGGGSSAAAITYAGSTNLAATDVEAALDELDAEKQPASAALTDLATKWIPTTATVPTGLKLAEATNNGTNTLTLTTVASLASDVTATFPNSNGTVCLVANIQTLSNKAISGASNTFSNIQTYALVKSISTKASSALCLISDVGYYLRFTGSNPTYTVQPELTEYIPLGSQIEGACIPTAMTIIQGAGVVINRARTLVTLGAKSGWMLIKVAADEWDLHGDFV